MIGRTNVGGGDNLNFKIVGGTTQPRSPKENTIWVNTDTAISSWEFSATEPTGTDGMVWFTTGTASLVSFNALKKNGIELQPYRACQYISGAWTDKTAMIYQNGEWLDLRMSLFSGGVVNTELTGGIYGELSANAIEFHQTVASGSNKTYTTKNAIDLTEYRAMNIRFNSPSAAEHIYFRLVVTSKISNGESFTTSDLVAAASADSPYNNVERVLRLDISDLSGRYYLGYTWGVPSSAGVSRNINGFIYDWWLG